jgi:Zn-dependent protease
VAKPSHFRIAGIPVRVELYFFIIIGILGYEFNLQNPKPAYIGSFVAIAFVGVVVHEMGHAIAFRRYGIDPNITLVGMGGVTSGSGRLTPRQSIVVSLAGPLTALILLGGPALWLWSQGTITSADGQVILYEVLWINVGWSVLNLLPMLPLDGGNVTRSLLDIATQGRGRRPAEIISIAVAVVGGVVALALGYVGLLLIVALVVGINVTSLSRAKQEELGDEMVFGQRALIQHRPIEAEQVAQTMLAKRPSGPTLRAASELLGWARLWQGDQPGAEAAVTRYAHAGAPTATFRAAQALAAGRLVEGVSVMVWAFANEPPGSTQVLGAIAIAGTGQTRPFVSDLLRLDAPTGVRAAVLFRQLLEYAGYQREAEVAAGMLAADGRAGSTGLDPLGT